MTEDKISTGNEVPSLFTLACQMQCCWSPESTLLCLGHPAHLGQTAEWLCDLDGPGEGRDIPRHRGHQNFREPLQMVLSEKWRHTALQAPEWDGFIFFPKSQFSWGVYILCNCCFKCCPLGVARWSLRWLQEAVLHWRGTALSQKSWAR